MDARLADLETWLQAQLPGQPFELNPLVKELSFRRYFRLQLPGETYIAMDAPPEKEDCGPFVAIAEGFAALGLQVPEILAQDLKQGFLLLSDFGDTLLLQKLPEGGMDLYKPALAALERIQGCSGVPNWDLPRYDNELFLEEAERFRSWYITRHYHITLSDDENALIDSTFAFLSKEMLAQPFVVVHRDFHSRNLMVLGKGEYGIIDFQDAIWGPVTLDLVSLLRDCYIAWSPAEVERWVLGYAHRAMSLGIIPEVSDTQFMRWFDMMSLQRHLRILT